MRDTSAEWETGNEPVWRTSSGLEYHQCVKVSVRACVRAGGREGGRRP